MQTFLAALSGGVDSAAAALLALRAGARVAAGTMLLVDGGEAECEQAAQVSRALGLDFHLFDLRAAFAELVIAPFCAAYAAGRTPNPCALCNPRIKFGLLLEEARSLGFDGLVTGHYARLTRRPDGRTALSCAQEAARDQSYFLYALSPQQLAHAWLPLGDRTKAEARELARQAGLPVAEKRDSQDICFAPDGDYLRVLAARGYAPTPGDLILEGRPVGRHAGQEGYTIGQRRGLGYAAGRRVYVTGKRGADVLLGGEEALYCRAVRLTDVTFQLPPPGQDFSCRCKLRAGRRFAGCTVQLLPGGQALVRFAEPQRAAAPGQACVFYWEDTVLGGGQIAGAEEET